MRVSRSVSVKEYSEHRYTIVWSHQIVAAHGEARVNVHIEEGLCVVDVRTELLPVVEELCRGNSGARTASERDPRSVRGDSVFMRSFGGVAQAS